MQRSEADGHIGKPVLVRSMVQGTYTGILLSVEGSPWRGRVQVTGLIKPAVHYEQVKGLTRRGYRVGETMEARAVCLLTRG